MKKTDTQIQTEIKRRDKAFKGATKAQQRVLIAKDVIKQVNSGFIIPYSGNFFKLDDSQIGNCSSDNLQKTFLGKEVSSCKCCALGSMMVSCTLFKNNETVEDIYHDFKALGERIEWKDTLKNGFNRIFSQKQLMLIEVAFERECGYFYDSLDLGERRAKAVKFGHLYDNPMRRLIAIMKNIIKNQGQFKP